jgi:thymidine kinase
MRVGRLIVICGPMFSGKTRELILRIDRAKRANRGVQVFVPAKDHRDGVGEVISHARQNLESVGVSATALEGAYGLAECVRHNVMVVGIDEAQFFEENLRVEVIRLVRGGREVVVAGLDLDSKGEPFGQLPELMAVADEVIKMQAVCVQCGGDARYTFRKSAQTTRVHIGAEESYEARCTACYYGQ